MGTITNRGRALREELNQAFGEAPDAPYIPFDRLADVSLLARRAVRYASRCEAECSYEWAQGEKWDRDTERLAESIRELALSLPGVEGVNLDGDPRGYVVKLHLSTNAQRRGNTWGGDESGWGVA